MGHYVPVHENPKIRYDLKKQSSVDWMFAYRSEEELKLIERVVQEKHNWDMYYYRADPKKRITKNGKPKPPPKKKYDDVAETIRQAICADLILSQSAEKRTRMKARQESKILKQLAAESGLPKRPSLTQPISHGEQIFTKKRVITRVTGDDRSSATVHAAVRAKEAKKVLGISKAAAKKGVPVVFTNANTKITF